MHILVLVSEHDAASRALKAAVLAAGDFPALDPEAPAPVAQEGMGPQGAIEVLDAYAPENVERVTAAGVSAFPCVVASRDDGSPFLRLEGEAVKPEAIVALIGAPAPVVEVPRVQFQAATAISLAVRHPDAAFAGQVPVTVNGQTEAMAALENGEGLVALTLPEAGAYLIAAGGPAAVLEVGPAPEPSAEPEPQE